MYFSSTKERSKKNLCIVIVWWCSLLINKMKYACRIFDGPKAVFVLRTSTKVICSAVNEPLLFTYAGKGEYLYRYVSNSSKKEGNFVIKCFFPFRWDPC